MRNNKNNSASLHLRCPPSQDVMTLQADLAEAAVLRQRQEETLRQRERELTALKGALKEEVECHDREMEALREQYGQDMENLRRTMEQVTQVLTPRGSVRSGPSVGSHQAHCSSLIFSSPRCSSTTWKKKNFP